MEKNDKNIIEDWLTEHGDLKVTEAVRKEAYWFDNLESYTPPITDLEKIKEYLFYTAQWQDPDDPYYISKDYLKQTIEFLNKLTPH